MSAASEGLGSVEFALRDGGRIVFAPTGFRHPAAVRFAGEVFTPYEVVTHVSVSARSVRVGTERSVYVLQRGAFRSASEAGAFVEELARRVAAAPGGPARIARMREIERTASLARPQRVTWGFLALCAALQVLQLVDGGRIEAAGAFSAGLVRSGEVWRLVTANLLHATPWLPIHFVLNGLALLALGSLLEWSIGSARTALVMAVAGVGAMSAGLLVDYEEALGASGVVMGVFGALVFLELRHGAELPAHWRLPRAVIWLGLCLQLILEGLAWAVLPIIATGAHVGGFVAGFATCAAVGGSGLRREPLEPWVLAGNGLAAVALLASLGSAAMAWREGPDLARRAQLLLSREDAPAEALNNLAWVIATGEHPAPADLDAALRLAERAAEATGRSDPNVLDTLAEVYFQRGERDAAVAVIEEAIRLAPRESYFLGQRDRFLGRRDPDDRPDPPAPPQPGPRLTPEESGPLDPSLPEVGV